MPTEQLKELVAQMPDPDMRGMYTENIDKEKIDKAIAAIHAGGAENVRGLIDMLGQPGIADDVKPRFALHCLTNHTLIVRDEAGRKALSETLAAELGGSRPASIQATLCEELGWAGHEEAIQPLGKLLTNEELCAPAAMALISIRKGTAAAFRAAWPQAKGKCRMQVIHGLAMLADPESKDIFKEALTDEDREVRLAAMFGLAKVGDAAVGDLLLKRVAETKGWERTQAAKNCLVLAERLAAEGKKSEGQRDAAKKLYERLAELHKGEHESHVREAVERGLVSVL